MWLRGASTLRSIGLLLLVRSIKDARRAHTVLGGGDGKESMDGLCHITTTAKGNKVFLLAVRSDVHKASAGNRRQCSLDLKLVVGDVTNSTGGKLSERIKWGDPKSFLRHIYAAFQKCELRGCAASGGPGVVVESDTLVFRV
ncbi:putative trans-sialidase [Trypanosoma cruzi]|nr:putative trans-sialidase [Trypanosoma cruzi]